MLAPMEEGGCCIQELGQCANTTEAICDGQGGVWFGPCTECPRQNVGLIEEADGTIFVHVIGPPVDCENPGGGGMRARACTGGPYYDVWDSPVSGQACHNFDAGLCSPPIPADFFGPGSDPFDGEVCLEGQPLGVTEYGEFAEADTLIQRATDPFDRCDLPSPTPRTVPIEIVALSLKSVDPITVTYNGGMSSEDWDVAVDLSAAPASTGSLNVIKEHCNGGTYTSDLNVYPKFTFTKVGEPTNQQVLDTGAEGICSVPLLQSDPRPWVSDVHPDLRASVDPCSDFHAGIRDLTPTTSCDCNENGVKDKCDIESATSGDCNGNGMPDECQPCVDHCECNDSDACTADRCVVGVCQHTGTKYGDPDHNGTISIFDVFCVLNGFGGQFTDCTFGDNDIEPCEGNDTLNIFDLFAVLNAFGGDDPCNCPPVP